jgi:hypothetical protein
MQQIHSAIQQSTFAAFKAEFLNQYQVTDEEVRLAQKQKWLSAPRHAYDAGGD